MRASSMRPQVRLKEALARIWGNCWDVEHVGRNDDLQAGGTRCWRYANRAGAPEGLRPTFGRCSRARPVAAGRGVCSSSARESKYGFRRT